MKYDIIVIGGGASGIIAAITAKDMGANVAILEGNDRIGKKILTTGNGRCNISNKNTSCVRYHSCRENFFEQVINSFTVNDTINFFSSIGLPLKTLEEGKMYPFSLQASSVVDVLRFALEDRDIPVFLNSKVTNIKHTKNGFCVSTPEEDYLCNKVILCTGGKSAPKTGSDGSGYELAKNLGHSIISPEPALVQLKLSYKNLKALSGVKFDGVVEIYEDSTPVKKEYGEVLFTDYGISGPPILQISRIASLGIKNSKSITLTVDMLPNMSKDELNDFLSNHFAMFGYRSISDALIGLINKKIIPILLKEAGVSSIHKACSDIDWKEMNKIIDLIKCWSFKVTGTNSFSDAQVTAGGIDTNDINPETLESTLIPGLYFAGEVLDVDGDCGGFNLQWAWSSGFVAAKKAATK